MTVLGIDISKYQLYDTSPPDAYDWQAAYQAGARFAFVRATRANPDGSLYTDPRLMDYVQNRQHIPIAGFYSYVRLEHDPLRQAEHLLLAIGDLPDARVAIDLEGDRPGSLTPAQAASRLQTWLDRLEAATSRLPVIYTRQGWFDAYVAPSSNWQRYPLWAARYPGIDGNYQPLLGSPWADGRYQPRDWGNWTFWQYTDFGPGARFGAQSSQIDLNLFNGSEEQLTELIGVPDGGGGTPPPVGEGLIFEVQVDFLNMRAGPGISFPVVDQLRSGDQVTAQDVDGSNAWVQVAPGRWVCVALNGRRYLVLKTEK